MDYKKLKKKTGITDADIARFFKFKNTHSFKTSSAVEKYRYGLCRFYSFLREGEKKKNQDTALVSTSAKENC